MAKTRRRAARPSTAEAAGAGDAPIPPMTDLWPRVALVCITVSPTGERHSSRAKPVSRGRRQVKRGLTDLNEPERCGFAAEIAAATSEQMTACGIGRDGCPPEAADATMFRALLRRAALCCRPLRTTTGRTAALLVQKCMSSSGWPGVTDLAQPRGGPLSANGEAHFAARCERGRADGRRPIEPPRPLHPAPRGQPAHRPSSRGLEGATAARRT